MLKKTVILCLALICVAGLSGWLAFPTPVDATPAEPVQQKIKELIRNKETAVNQKDKKRFLSVLNPSYPFYVQEQKRWFEDAVRWVDPGSYRLRVISMIPEKEHQIRAWVEQRYTRQGRVFAIRFPLLFQETEKGWKDSDFPFLHTTRGNVVIRYTDEGLREQASIALESAHKAIQELGRKMDWTPRHSIEVKIYHRPELFRQSVKPSLPAWAGGWHESGESVKLIGAKGFSDQQFISSVLVHEMTHMMVSDTTGDNAAYWLQEGAAEYFQTHLLPGLRTQEEKKYEKPRWRMSRLEKLNLEHLHEEEASHYYTQCYQLFRYLMNTYGEKKVRRLFSVLQLSPEEDKETVDKISLVNQRTREAVKKVFGKSLAEIERDWIRDMKKKKSTLAAG
ncbi:hypothetical protein C8P63_1412 [Melghirimyces profundicolus]|uniref:Peptidase MA-like domain-containing protein n=1 Tax=Melghirimyces profundicolus TaxID=1242148 RepID=A0A2T6AZV9_9BACL|nr:hypothetical protein [Melghirimyces profundicolus]PTX49340.1 hypothetical protein C8P63_1412 [Melghirimyces profundicolus]